MTIPLRPSPLPSLTRTLAAAVVPLGQHDDVKLAEISQTRWWWILSEMGIRDGAAQTTSAEEGLEFKVIEEHLPTSEDLRRLIEVIHVLGNQHGRDLLREWLRIAQLDPQANHPAGENPDHEGPAEFVARIWLLARRVPAAQDALQQALHRAEVRLDKLHRCFPAVDPIPDRRVVRWDAAIHKTAIETGVLAMLAEDRVIPFIECIAMEDADGVLTLKITHGEPTRPYPCIVSSSSRSVIRIQRARVDILRYSPITDELTVCCNRVPLVRSYVPLIGRVLFGTPDYFSADPLINLSKLRNASAIQRAQQNIPQLRDVVVTKLRLREDDLGGADTFEHPDGVLSKIARQYPGASVTVLSASLTFRFFPGPGSRTDERVVVKVSHTSGIQHEVASVHQPAVKAFFDALEIHDIPQPSRSTADWTAFAQWTLTASEWVRLTGGKPLTGFEQAGLLVREDRAVIEDPRMGPGPIEVVEVAGQPLAVPADPVQVPRVVTSTELETLRCDLVRQAQRIGTVLGTNGNIGILLLDGRVIDLGVKELAGHRGYHAFLIVRPVTSRDLGELSRIAGRFTPVGLMPPTPRDDAGDAGFRLVQVSLPSISCDGFSAEILRVTDLADVADAVDLAPLGTELTLDETTQQVWWQSTRTLINLRPAEFQFLLQVAKTFPHLATHAQLRAVAGETANKRKGPLTEALAQAAGPGRGELISPRSGVGYVLNCRPYVKEAVPA